MSTPNVTPSINPETVGDPAQTQAQAQPSAAPAQGNTPDDSGGGGGFLSHVGHVLTHLGGRPPASYTVDDKGNTVANQADATPGQLFKNLLVGALNGLAAGSQLKGNPGFGAGLAAGFEGEEKKLLTKMTVLVLKPSKNSRTRPVRPRLPTNTLFRPSSYNIFRYKMPS